MVTQLFYNRTIPQSMMLKYHFTGANAGDIEVSADCEEDAFKKAIEVETFYANCFGNNPEVRITHHMTMADIARQTGNPNEAAEVRFYGGPYWEYLFPDGSSLIM